MAGEWLWSRILISLGKTEDLGACCLPCITQRVIAELPYTAILLPYTGKPIIGMQISCMALRVMQACQESL